MIVAVKRNKKQNLLKILSLLILIIISTTYYFHMKKVNEERQLKELELKQTQKLKKEKKEKEEKEEKEKKQFEKAILTEIEKAIDLIGQENVQNVKIIDDKVIIICEANTNLDALMVRYGAMALTKKTLNEIIIAVDINFILKSRLNEK